MPQELRASQQRANAYRCLFVAVAAAALVCLPSAALHAQTLPVHGYITAVHPSNGFDINGYHVITTAQTRYGWMNAKNPVSNGPMQDTVQLGAWVEVYGPQNRKVHTVTAETVLFRDDWDRTFIGLGEIEKVISTAPDLVIAADGYRIRVTAATDAHYPKDVKSPAGVYAGMWVLYEGKLDRGGLLAASKARFVTTYRPKLKAAKAPGNSTQPPAEIQIDDERTEIELDNITYKISKDQALQSRVRRVGMRLVPAFQKQLPADDPSKLPFYFIAVNDPTRQVRSFSNFEGDMLVSEQLAARLKSDDQLAAVLADGIALRLQEQAPIVFSRMNLNRASLEEGVVVGAANLVPYGGLVAGSVYQHERDKELNEERLRMALQLMAEAGYDPWQAPQAWRLAEPRKLPADTSKLNYPDSSGYQLAILDLTYKKARPARAAVSGSTAESRQPAHSASAKDPAKQESGAPGT